MSKNNIDPLKPSLPLLCNLASIVVHAEEAMSPDAHRFDVSALKSALNDPATKAWISAMTKLAFAPVKRV